MAHMYLDENLNHIEVGSLWNLEGSEAHHAATVSRLRAGERVILGNGRGVLAQTEAVSVSKSRVQLHISSLSQVNSPATEIVLVQGLAKGDRDERAIEAATELGVSEVVPWSAARSVSRWQGDKVSKGVVRWEHIVREATKQSIRAWLPLVSGLESTSDIAQRAENSILIVLDPTGTESLTSAVVGHESNRITLVVGPEGGITPEELEQLSQAGARIVRLGSHILRTSTAGPSAISAMNEVLQLW